MFFKYVSPKSSAKCITELKMETTLLYVNYILIMGVVLPTLLLYPHLEPGDIIKNITKKKKKHMSKL